MDQQFKDCGWEKKVAEERQEVGKDHPFAEQYVACLFVCLFFCLLACLFVCLLFVYISLFCFLLVS